MGRYAAFLRGINLGGRRVTGDQLQAPFRGLGFDDVASFLASGNVVFSTPDADDAETLVTRIESALEADLGFPVRTFLRSERELEAIVAHDPFPPEAYERSSGKLQVMLLPGPPGPEAAEAALAHASADDLLALHGRELFWLPSGGISQSALDPEVVGRLVGPATVRTANTLTRLYRRFFA